jgi:hypothetical protein
VLSRALVLKGAPAISGVLLRAECRHFTNQPPAFIHWRAELDAGRLAHKIAVIAASERLLSQMTGMSTFVQSCNSYKALHFALSMNDRRRAPLAKAPAQDLAGVKGQPINLRSAQGLL